MSIHDLFMSWCGLFFSVFGRGETVESRHFTTHNTFCAGPQVTWFLAFFGGCR